MAIRWRGASGRTRECTELTVEGDRGFESIFLQRRVHCEPDFQQPTTFKLVINLSNAKALGLTINRLPDSFRPPPGRMRQPHGDAMTGPDAVAGEVRRQPVGGSNQLGITQRRRRSRTASLQSRPCVPRGEMVDRLVAPEPGRGIGGNGRWVRQRHQWRRPATAHLRISHCARSPAATMSAHGRTAGSLEGSAVLTQVGWPKTRDTIYCRGKGRG
jgi:hypothetical protein